MINTKFNLYKAEWLDLVFADRNKSYGAYDLRIHYGANMMRALAITVLGFSVAAVSMNIVLKHNKTEDGVKITDVVLPPNIKLPPDEKTVEAIKRTQPKGQPNTKQATSAPNVKTQRFVEYKPTNDPVTTEPPRLDNDVAISSVDNKGDITKPVTRILDGTPGKGVSNGTSDGTNVSTNDPVDIGGLDIMPEPYGGAAAWAKFLQKNLRYPDTELQGRVVISFIIERDGKLTDLNIVKGVDNLLDREALRVLKLAPAWKPGQQNGKPVRVKYTIPIVFQMNE
jgi:protein TonB